MRSRRWGYVAAWVVAATVAVVVGIAAVSQVGASIRGRGPLGNEVVRDPAPGQPERPLTPDPGTSMQRKAVRGEFGSFLVGCRGVVAYGEGVEPAPGWRSFSYEEGPDDDVDAVFENTKLGRSIEIEVFCNQGRPTVGDLESNTLSDQDED